MTAHEKLARFLCAERDKVARREQPGSCPDENLWSLLAEGLIRPEERDELIGHIADCPTCRRRAAQVLAEADQAHLSLPPSELIRRRPMQWIRLRPAICALAAVVGIAVGVGLYWSAMPRQRGFGVNASRFVLAEADLTALGIDLKQRSMRAGLRAAIDQKTYASAIGKLRPELDLSEPDARALALAARAALTAHFADDGARYAAKWTKRSPDDPAAWNALGMARYLQGRYSEALDAFRRAATLEPAHVEYQLNAALAADEADQIRQAIGHLKRTVELAPEHPRINAIRRWLDRLEKLQEGTH